MPALPCHLVYACPELSQSLLSGLLRIKDLKWRLQIWHAGSAHGMALRPGTWSIGVARRMQRLAPQGDVRIVDTSP